MHWKENGYGTAYKANLAQPNLKYVANYSLFVTQFGLTLTENKICFPQPLCYQQRAIYVCACCEKLYEKSIRFSDIVYINNNNGQRYVLY